MLSNEFNFSNQDCSITFSTSKNGEKTFTIQNSELNEVFFHSSYSPSKEAERFFNQINFSYSPSYIILLEPGLPYLYSLFKQKYPQAKVGVVRLIKELEDEPSPWDFQINLYIKNEALLKNQLKQYINEENFLLTQVVSNPISDKYFSETINFFWNVYKSILEESKTLLVTRQYFERKWFVNSVNFVKNVSKTFYFNNKLQCPIFIIASGPSLKDVLPVIQQNQNKVFIIALSSAIKTLILNHIKIDLVLTTDGGYWAGQHLKGLLKDFIIPVAAPCEAYIQKHILQNNPILPLNYSDGITKDFFDITNIQFFYAERNGTVSGTALRFAQAITDNSIYFFGLDLAPQKGFQHTQPNELDLNNSSNFNRINSKLNSYTTSQFNSGSLEIYKNWFCNLENISNVYRVIETSQRKNSLGKIKDLSIQEFTDSLSNLPEVDKSNICSKPSEFNDKIKQSQIKILKEYILQNANNEKWNKQLFPIDTISMIHNEKTENYKTILDNFNKKKKEFLKKVGALLDE